MFRAYPELARPLHEFAHRLLRGPSPFTEGEREVLAAYVSRLTHCAFCEASHTAVAALYGYDRTIIEQLAQDLTHANIAERLKPVFRYVRRLTLAPARVDQAEVTAMYEAGWDETAVIHGCRSAPFSIS